MNKEEIFAAHWANADRYLIAVFNNAENQQDFAVVIDRSIVSQYGYKLPGQMNFKVLGANGLLNRPVGNRNIQRQTSIVFSKEV